MHIPTYKIESEKSLHIIYGDKRLPQSIYLFVYFLGVPSRIFYLYDSGQHDGGRKPGSALGKPTTAGRWQRAFLLERKPTLA